MAESSGPAIRTESLTKIYQGRQIALNCVDLTVESGEVVGVLGQNGAGKTTLVKLLLGLHAPTAGRVFILGKKMTPNAAPLRRRMGYVPADPKFPDGMTPIAYLDFVGRLSGLMYTVRRARLATLLRAVDLLRVSGQPIQNFSSGMKSRLAIAASLINDPQVLIWDEPAQGLDPDARRSMLALVKTLAESKTLLLCSHHLTDVQEVCSRALVLADGQVVFSGGIDELRGAQKPAEVEITFVGDKREVAETVKAIQGFEEIESCSAGRGLLRVRIRPDASPANGLANVLVTLADHNLEITDLRVCGQATEQAILKLMVQETSRGFTRAHQPIAA